MNQLAKLQHTFQNSVLAPGTSISTAWISASGRATAETQLSIYSYAYKARLKEVLANDYPVILMAIGDDDFNQLTELYIEEYPSYYFSLRDFGAHLAVFISRLIQQPGKQSIKRQKILPWLYELALFEWSLGQAFDAKDAGLFSEQDMSSIPAEAWPELKFTLHPSVQRLDFEWNIVEIWQALTSEIPAHVNSVRGESSPWLIWREQLITRFRSMKADEAIAFGQLEKGHNFNEICEALTTIINENEVPMHAASLLKGWITQGLISSVK